MSTLPTETRDWLTGPGLARLWPAVRNRLEHNGLRARGSLRLSELEPRERTALSQLLGRALTTSRVTVRLDVLDARLRASAAGCGLVQLLTALGPPLTDRQAAREDAEARRARVWSSTAQVLEASALADEEWARWWLEGLRRTGVPNGVEYDAAVHTLHRAVQVLVMLLCSPTPSSPRGRGELAAEVTGSAHGLDEGTWLARIVQRGLALAFGTEVPETASARRALWRHAAVMPDEISSTVLSYGLRPESAGWREEAVLMRTVHATETHLTLRDLRDMRPAPPAGTLVRICENPRVVEAAADSACTQPIVCTSGNASTVVLTLLDSLAAAGCSFAYHGDFDWQGVTLAHRVMHRYDAHPWRLGADDYEHLAAHVQEQRVPPLPLSGSPVATPWDPALAPTMAAFGIALHEEATLDLLVEDLT